MLPRFPYRVIVSAGLGRCCWSEEKDQGISALRDTTHAPPAQARWNRGLIGRRSKSTVGFEGSQFNGMISDPWESPLAYGATHMPFKMMFPFSDLQAPGSQMGWRIQVLATMFDLSVLSSVRRCQHRRHHHHVIQSSEMTKTARQTSMTRTRCLVSSPSLQAPPSLVSLLPFFGVLFLQPAHPAVAPINSGNSPAISPATAPRLRH